MLAVLLLAGAVALPAAAHQRTTLNGNVIHWQNSANATLSTDCSTGANDVAQNVYGYAYSHPKQLNEARRVTSRNPQPALG
ncbi:hypothetical protein ASE43_08315 [Lysobacter sp. Root983]|nr:hypothetical protein ASE43_08315 [Lysobacter sp. Root983]